jgi:hypothetical protein
MFHRIPKTKKIVFLCLLVLMSGIATALRLTAQQGTAQEKTQEHSQPQLPSMAETQTVLFDGQIFGLNANPERRGLAIYDYYLPSDSYDMGVSSVPAITQSGSVFTKSH